MVHSETEPIPRSEGETLAKKVTSRKRPKDTHLIRPVHIRNLARRKEFGNVARVSSNDRLISMVRNTLMEYATNILESLIAAREQTRSKNVSFDEHDVDAVTGSPKTE